MENRNAIAHNPLFMQAFDIEGIAAVRATIQHQQKTKEFGLVDVQMFADEADAVAAELMEFAMNFPKALQDEIDVAKALLFSAHLRRPE
jgi:hypothetical protein